MTYDNVKSHKKQRFTQSLEVAFFEKPQAVGGGVEVGGQIESPDLLG